MNIAIAGAGTMGQIYARQLRLIDDISVTGIFDSSLEKAEHVAKVSGAKAYDSFEKMMKEADPDAVCICLPTFLHKEWTLKIADLGKHVICEKPIAGNLEDAEAMLEACGMNGVKLFVAHVLRFFPDYADLKRQIDAGKIGKVGVVHLKRMGPHPGKASSWYNDPAKSGGVIMDLLIHDIDYIRWVLGEVKSVYAVRKRTPDIEYALVTLRMQQGGIVNMEGFWGYPGPFAMAAEFSGTKGILHHDSSQESPLIVRKYAQEASASEVAVPENPSLHDPYMLELWHFTDCLKGLAEPIITAEDGYKALQIAAAVEQSISSGLPVRLGGERHA